MCAWPKRNNNQKKSRKRIPSLNTLSLRCNSLHVAVSSSHSQFRSIHADLNVTTLAALQSRLRIVAETVLMAKLLSNFCKRVAQLRAVVRRVETSASLRRQLVQILICELVIGARRPGTTRFRIAVNF